MGANKHRFLAMEHAADAPMDDKALAYVESLLANSAKAGAEETWYCIAVS